MWCLLRWKCRGDPRGRPDQVTMWVIHTPLHPSLAKISRAPPLYGTQTLISRCWLGRGNINAHAFGNACSQVTVYLVPELERTLLNVAFDTLAQMPSDVAGQMFAVCLGKDVSVEITR